MNGACDRHGITLGRPRCRWVEGYDKSISLKCGDGVYWIELARKISRWQACVKHDNEISGPLKAGRFLAS
jgi:hypothetical protein